VLYG